MGVIKALYERYLQLFKPIKWCKKIGLNFEESSLHIYGKVSFGSEPWIITIGRNVYITTGCQFVTHDGGVLIFRKDIPDLEITKPITVGDNVYFGNNVMVLPGVHIGNNVVIGACSVVTKDIPDNSVYAGNPARFIETTEEYLNKLKKQSLHLGNLVGKAKDDKLKEYYGYKKAKK